MSAFSFALTLAITVGGNWLVDPYGMFGAPRMVGINALKPRAGDRIRFAKPYYADRISARTVIAGNSRPEAGLDPQSACWPSSQRPVFNAAVPGASLELQIAYAEHAMVAGEVTGVYLGLDLLDFLGDPSADPVADPPHRFSHINLRVGSRGIDNPEYGRSRAREWVAALASLATLSDSVDTVLRQRQADLTTRRADGFNPARDYVGIIRREGQAVLFRQKNRELVQLLGRDGNALFQQGQRWSSAFDTLAKFLDRSGARGIRVTLFINPYHLDYLTAIRETGQWQQLDAWKETLVEIAVNRGVPLWDFNAVNPDTTEAPPAPGDRLHTLRAFWEPAHYRSQYGERMLAAMLASDCATTDDSGKRVGRRLDQPGLSSHLRTLRHRLDQHLSSDTAALGRIRCLIDPGTMEDVCSGLRL